MLAVYGGSAAHHRALNEPKYAKWLAGTVYLPELADSHLAEADLPDYDVLVVPERLHAGKLQEARPRLLEALDEGRTVVVFGEQSVYGEHPQGLAAGHRLVSQAHQLLVVARPGRPRAASTPTCPSTTSGAT